ncbi:MAG: alpha/beta hydrolase [Planctomycetaceae bacterium]|jgi:esterase/lipase superfamily enzyme|nr:alpha/beta hydrolase [Planctomycetaceae bacterium]
MTLLKNFFCFAFLVLLTSTSSFAGQQDVWLIDSHSVPWTHASETGFDRIAYYQLVNHRWIKSSANEFFKTQNPETPLVIFSPGYTSTTSDTVEIGAKLVRLYSQNHHCRTVFWQWPADRQFLCLSQDIRAKIPVADTSGQYLTMFLRKLKPESKICMIGFSFGNRIICDAVQNSGDLGFHIHLVLIAAATDRLWLSAHSRHADVSKIAEKIFVFYNPDDRALKFYPFLYGSNYHTDALGRFGPCLSQISEENRNKIESINANRYVGKYHRTINYIQTSFFRQRINDYLLFESKNNLLQTPKIREE